MLSASQAHALCIVNRSAETVAFTRGGPYAGMERFMLARLSPAHSTVQLYLPGQMALIQSRSTPSAGKVNVLSCGDVITIRMRSRYFSQV